MHSPRLIGRIPVIAAVMAAGVIPKAYLLTEDANAGAGERRQLRPNWEGVSHLLAIIPRVTHPARVTHGTCEAGAATFVSVAQTLHARSASARVCVARHSNSCG